MLNTTANEIRNLLKTRGRNTYLKLSPAAPFAMRIIGARKRAVCKFPEVKILGSMRWLELNSHSDVFVA